MRQIGIEDKNVNFHEIGLFLLFNIIPTNTELLSWRSGQFPTNFDDQMSLYLPPRIVDGFTALLTSG